MTDEPRVLLDPFVAEVFTAMAASSEAATGRVFDNFERTISEWQERYLSLYEAIAEANVKVDSARIQYILGGSPSVWADQAAQARESN